MSCARWYLCLLLLVVTALATWATWGLGAGVAAYFGGTLVMVIGDGLMERPS